MIANFQAEEQFKLYTKWNKIFIGPMSKNVVDSIIEFNKIRNENVGIIPSRRQVEFDGGYSNNWTTRGLREYAPGLIIKEIMQCISRKR